MSVKWTARVLTGTLTMVFMTQPGFAVAAAKKSATGHATHAADHVATKKRLNAIQLRGEDVGAGIRLKHEARLASLANQVDVEARENPAAVPERLAAEFGTTVANMTAEHGRVGGSWGDLMIAHTLHANMHKPIPPSQVFHLHRDGMAWTMVAHGLGLDVQQFVKAVENERRVAMGEARADGRVHAIGPASAGNTSLNEE